MNAPCFLHRRIRRGTQMAAVTAVAWLVGLPVATRGEPIHVGFLWHMHQPIYYPYENIITTNSAGHFSFSVVDVHNQRHGPYKGWPREAVQLGLSLPHLGASVSFSGSLIENLNNLRAAGVNGGLWNNWDADYDASQAMLTSLGNRRLDLVAFGYHHPLMPLLDDEDIRMQIRLHKHIYAQTWSGGASYPTGMFPAETAFSTRMIPALAAEGIDWVLVDNIHFDRACEGYPHTNASCLYAPNRADQVNPDPSASGGAWVQLNNLWAPSRVSAPFGYRPHYVQHINPDTGAATRIVAVPAARYEGNEDGRGGYGAFLYDQVMDAYLPYNTDPAHPMLVVLHHDGDNFGGGSDAYYHHNFQNMVNWASADPDYDVTTIQDYLDRFPPAPSDVIHVEDGSWAGADCGDPEFKKWLGDPNAAGWSPDRNSWAVLTAAKNRVFTAESVAPAASMQNVMTGAGTNTERAWHYLLVSQASDYWYWDGTEIWDSNVTRGCNQAVAYADAAIAGRSDNVAPTIFVPQREPYNPGGFEWGATPEPSDFEVWTYVYDVSGLTSVTLRWRVDQDGFNPIGSVQNETYAGGPEVGAWQSVAMSATAEPGPQNGVLAATYRAVRYAAEVTGQTDVLIDYYVEAVDSVGHVKRSAIQHVYVGQGAATGGGDVVAIDPDPPVAGQQVTIRYNPTGRPLAGAGSVRLHYGFNGWNPVVSPDPVMTWSAAEGVWIASVPVAASATQLDVVFNDGSGTWDNNGGADWHFAVTGGEELPTWELDGALDEDAMLVASNGGLDLYAGLIGETLYIATQAAAGGNDRFILVANPPGALGAAPWAKAGQVAGWGAFLANEVDNGWSGWFDTSGTVQQARAAWLEGTINLVEEFGAMPTQIHLAVASYGTGNGAALASALQVPASVNGNGNLEATEYLMVDLCAITVGSSAGSPGDFDGNCVVNVLDYDLFERCLGGPAAGPAVTCGGIDADLDDDGRVDLRDYTLLQSLIGS